MDIIMVNAVYFSNIDSIHIGQFVLRDILKNEYSVECLNFDLLNKNEVIKYTENFSENTKIMGDYILAKNPKIVGFYTICNAFVTSIKLAEYIKNKNSNIKIIFGGPQATVTSEECLNAFDFLDAICLGESENTIKPLVKALLTDNDFDNIQGVAYKKDNKIYKNQLPELISDEELSKYTIYDYKPFNITPDMSFSLEGGRGCPFNCTFCTTSTFWGRKYRIKKVKDLINEMNKLNELYGVTKFTIQHDMFTANREYIKEFCKENMNNKITYDWSCSSRIDVLDEELIDLMKESNCTSMYLGIETGSERMQKIVSKNLKLDNALNLIKYIKLVGIEMTISFIYCYADEKIEDFVETIKMLETLLCYGVKDIQLHRFMPLPSTIEANKVIDRMYYDVDTVEITLNNIKLTDDCVDNLIKQYPNMFSQYYTFDSEVKDKYIRFDFFIEIIDGMNEFYFNSIKYLIKKYGLEKLYKKYESSLKELYKKYNSELYLENLDKRDDNVIGEFNEFLVKLFKDELGFNDLEFKEIFRYDNTKFEYFISKTNNVKIEKFSINIGKLINEDILIKEDYYVKYWIKNEKVYTTHLKLKQNI